MAVTHTPLGFTGTVDQAGEAKRLSARAARFTVADSTSWAVASVTTSNLTVSVAAGTAQCCGVYDSTPAADTLTLTANGGSTNRLDAIVARWTWGTTPSVTFAVLTGTSATVPPTPTRTPGTLYEAILAVVLVTPGLGSIPPTNVSDIRVYGSASGPLVIPQINYFTYIDVPVAGEVAVGSPLGARYRQTASGLQHVGDGLPVSSFTGAFLGTAYTPGTGTLWHDVGTATLAVGAGSSAVFAFPRTYAGIITMQVTPGDNNAGLGIVVPILTNMSVSSGFNGVVYTQTGGGITAGAAVRLNYDLWGWTNP
jgi:hypothetical protein